MADNQVIEHRYPDGLPNGPEEYVKVEQTTRGPKWEIKATSPERFGEMFAKLKAEAQKHGIKMDE